MHRGHLNCFIFFMNFSMKLNVLTPWVLTYETDMYVPPVLKIGGLSELIRLQRGCFQI